MDYNINFSAFGSIFAVPSIIVDKHIKLAGSAQLKVLLWVLRNADVDYKIDDISHALGIPAPDISDSLQYWVEVGLMIKSGTPADEKVAAGMAEHSKVSKKSFEKDISPTAVLPNTIVSPLVRPNPPNLHQARWQS